MSLKPKRSSKGKQKSPARMKPITWGELLRKQTMPWMGGSHKGDLIASVNELNEKIGEPEYSRGQREKTTVSWKLGNPNTAKYVEIYDYKGFPNPDNKTLRQRWHVGSNLQTHEIQRVLHQRGLDFIPDEYQVRMEKKYGKKFR